MKELLTFLGTGRIVALIVCAVLSGLAFFLKFCIPGYSFSALVCFCLIVIILFYTFMPLVGLKFPLLAKITTKAFSVILIAGHKKSIVGDYKHSRVLSVAGCIIAVLTLFFGIKGIGALLGF